MLQSCIALKLWWHTSRRSCVSCGYVPRSILTSLCLKPRFEGMRPSGCTLMGVQGTEWSCRSGKGAAKRTPLAVSGESANTGSLKARRAGRKVEGLRELSASAFLHISGSLSLYTAPGTWGRAESYLTIVATGSNDQEGHKQILRTELLYDTRVYIFLVWIIIGKTLFLGKIWN